MAKGYIIARVTVEDDEAYMRYAQGAGAAMKKYGARILARGGKHEPLDGLARPRNVIGRGTSSRSTARCCCIVMLGY